MRGEKVLKKKKTYRIFSLVFLLIIAVSVLENPIYAQNNNLENGSYIPYDGYKTVADNKLFSLSADMETGLFTLYQKETGKSWHSTPIDAENDKISKGPVKTNVRSQIVAEYIYRSDESHAETTQSANSRSECINSGSVKVEQVTNGIRVTYCFETVGFEIPVVYTLESDYLKAEIETEKIKEGKDSYLMAINLLPAFGAGNSEDDGSLFVPDGCGALIHFNNGVSMKQQYDEYVYGDDLAQNVDEKSNLTETIRLPVFATITSGSSLLGVITEGAALSSISVINGNGSCGYNAVSAKLHIRQLNTRVMFANNAKNKRAISRVSAIQKTSFVVRYYPIKSDENDVCSLANCYRSYLENEKGLKKKNTTPALNVDLYGSVDTVGHFLGIPYTKKSVLTSFDQARNIIEVLSDSTEFSVSGRYIGWNNSGVLNNKLPKNASPLSSLGGKKKLKKLINQVKRQGNSLSLEGDMLYFRSGKNSNSVKTIFGQFALQYDYLPSVFVTNQNRTPLRLLTPGKISEITNRFLKSFSQFTDVGISLSTLGNTCYSEYADGREKTRENQKQICVEALCKASKEINSVTLETANDYAAIYSDRILNAPVTSSGYALFDEDVPFYQMVFHGYIALSVPAMIQSAEINDNFLMAVSTGSELLYTASYNSVAFLSGTRYDGIYGSEFSMWSQDAIDKMQKYSGLLKDISNKTIIGYTSLSNEVFKTDFENGVSVIVNYGNSEVKFQESILPAKDYLVIGDDKK